jgi:hypothetical protein
MTDTDRILAKLDEMERRNDGQRHDSEFHSPCNLDTLNVIAALRIALECLQFNVRHGYMHPNTETLRDIAEKLGVKE